ncbi:RNA-binding protein 5 [Amphibalanus amphitrite]|uniref:RNA-binding protein 5 n=1 Tax=Amphibalanus amphitrite TaxID=1232801 RepID=A0A6A4VHW1_AMPAM|nr:RNA-binding protein 5 [Amphibalanus amphitrite]
MSRREPRSSRDRSRDRDRDRPRSRDREDRDWDEPRPPPPPRVWDMEPDPRELEHERQLQLAQHHAAAAAAAHAVAVSNAQQQLFMPNLMPQPFLAPILPAPTPLDTATLINMNLAAAAQLQQEAAAAPELLFRSQQPNNTVMIRGLAQHVTENDIRQEILNVNLTPKDIRLIRKKDSGASRGFAFVEFSTVQEAARWMELKQGLLVVQDQYRAVMQYSLPKDGLPAEHRPLQDWFCVKCGAHNFKRRCQCYKCGSDRAESEAAAEGSDEVSPHPTNTLLLRGLDPLSTEETVLSGLQQRTQLPIRSVRLGREPVTGASRGICYLELASVVDAMQLNQQLQAEPLVVEGRSAVVSYCRLADQAAGQLPVDTSRMSILELAEYSAKLYAKTPEEYEAYLKYYEDYYKTHGTGSAPSSDQSQSDSANAAAAVAQTALQRVQKKVPGAREQPTAPAAAPQPQPQAAPAAPFDEDATYRDTTRRPATTTTPRTSLYYDANSQYFYNPANQRYLYWDAAKSKYVPMPTDGEASGAGGSGKKKEDKHEKVKVAKKIAKDMERWAKSMKRKEARATASPIIPIGSTAQERAARDARSADIGYAMFEKRVGGESTPQTAAGAEAEAAANSSLVAAYGGESGDEEEAPELDPTLVDVNKLACLLCKRAFASREQLNKHLEKSDLHRKNLEEHQRAQGGAPTGGGQYRDRAAERRSKYGEPNQAPRAPHRPAGPPPPAAATASAPARPVGGIGNRMMQAMGWKDGQGLGKSNQGRTSLVEAERRATSAGLGMAGSTTGAVAGDTYKDCVKKTMFARYKEMNEE